MIKLSKSWDHRRCFFFGYLIQTVCCGLLGFTWTLRGNDFFLACFALRAVQGLGAALVSAAALNVMVGLQERNVMSGSLIFDSLVGLSRVIGAPFGALVFHLFGGGVVSIKVSFWFLGGLNILLMFLAPGSIILPPLRKPKKEADTDEEQVSDSRYVFSELFSFPGVPLSLLALFMIDVVYGLLEPTLSIHLYESFQMDVWDRAQVFMELGFAGLVMAPLAGCIGEYWSRKATVGIGSLLAGCALMGVGFSSTAMIVQGWAGLLGAGLSLVCTPSIPAMLWDIPPDSTISHDEASRATNTIAAVAAVIGPIYGASMAEFVSFEWMVTYAGSALLLYGVLLLVAIYGTGAIDSRNVGPDSDKEAKREGEGSPGDSYAGQEEPLLVQPPGMTNQMHQQQGASQSGGGVTGAHPWQTNQPQAGGYQGGYQ